MGFEHSVALVKILYCRGNNLVLGKDSVLKNAILEQFVASVKILRGRGDDCPLARILY